MGEAIDFAHSLLYFKLNIMNNKNISTLYLYTKTGIDSGVNVRDLQKALSAVQNVLDNCCTTKHKVSTVPFLNTFYKLLNGMNKKISRQKYIAVHTLLSAKIDCCNA
jgi:hypothetical protein